MPHANSRLRQTRLRNGLSQLELAVRAGVSTRTVQLAEAGREISLKTLDRISNALEIRSDQIIRIDEAHGDDEFINLPWSISDRFRSGRVHQYTKTCENELEVTRAIRNLRDNFSVQIEKWGSGCEQAEARERDARLTEAFSRYEQRYLEIWRKNPYCICVDRVDDTICGISIVLPLRKDCFDEFLSGTRSLLDVGADDVEENSQYLLIDSVTEFTNQCKRSWYKITESLSFITFSQIARLAIAPQNPEFQMVSFSASPLNERRLRSSGFVLREHVEPEFGYRICHFGETMTLQSPDQFARWSTIKHFAQLVRKVESKAFHRMLIRRGLAMVKRMQFSRGAKELANVA